MTWQIWALFASNIILLAACIISAVTDVRKMKILNLVTFPSILAGAVLTLAAGIAPVEKLVVFLILFLLDGAVLKGGDTKLTMASVMLTGNIMWFMIAFVAAQLWLLAGHVMAEGIEHPKVMAYRAKDYIYPFAPCMLAGIMADACAAVIIL